mgnify:CR=1 FL=1
MRELNRAKLYKKKSRFLCRGDGFLLAQNYAADSTQKTTIVVMCHIKSINHAQVLATTITGDNAFIGLEVCYN